MPTAAARRSAVNKRSRQNVPFAFIVSTPLFLDDFIIACQETVRSCFSCFFRHGGNPFRKINGARQYNGAEVKPIIIAIRQEESTMHTKAYCEARKEFINCIVLSPICIGVSLIIAFTEWLPIMRAEKNKTEE